MSRNILPRVAFVSHSPWLAGAERALINLLEHLPRQAIQPIVIFPNTDGPVKRIAKEELRLPVFDLPYGLSLPATGQCDFNARLKQEVAAFESLYRELEVDAVVVNTTVIYPAAVAAARAGVPLIVHSHGALFPRLLPWLDLQVWTKLNLLQLQIADKVLVPSSWVATYCKQIMRLPQGAISVLPNGTAIPQLHEGGNEYSRSAVPEFVMLCTMEPNKGVWTFLEAATKVLTNRPAGAIFTVYGDGAPEYRESLDAFIKQHNLEGQCFLHPKQADVDSIYRRCCAAIVASEIESFSFVAIEAMSYAKPVIATRCGGPEDIVVDGETGYLIPVGDSDLLAERIISLMDNPGLAYQMGLSARGLVASHYDINKVAHAYLEHILDVIHKPRDSEILNRIRLLIALEGFGTSDMHSEEATNFADNDKLMQAAKSGESGREEILINTLLRIKKEVAQQEF